MLRKWSRIAGVVALAGFILVLFAAARAEDHPYAWQTAPFGGGGHVPAYLYHPKKPGILYAGTDVGGRYRFDYAGQRWLAQGDCKARGNDGHCGMGGLATGTMPR